MANSFKIFQSNVQSLNMNRSEIQRVLEADNYDVALLSETWTKTDLEKTNKYKISNYHSIFHSRSDDYGGAAVFLKKAYNYFPIQLPTLSNFTQTVAIRVASLDLVLVSIYISPSIPNNTFEDDLLKIFNVLRAYKKTIVGGDLNAHHYIWDDEADKPDRRGEILLQLINDNHLLLLNNGSKTFVPIQMNRRASAIDLTMCTADIFPDTAWKVLDFGIGGSHHLSVESTITTTQPNREIRYIYNHRKITEDLSKLDHTEVRNIEDLMSSVKKVSKKHRRKDQKEPKFWWSDNVDQAWKDKTQARIQFNRSSSVENLIEYKKKAAIFQRLKRQESRKKLQEFANELTPFTDSKELWRRVGRLTGKRSYRKENNVIWEVQEEAEEFMDTHFGDNDVRIVGDYGVVANYDLLDLETWNKILHRKKNTAPGDDRITYDMLRSLSTLATKNIIDDLNRMWRNGRLSETLKTIRVVAIPKPGRDQSTASGKRPISLVSTPTKIVNSAVLEKLQDFLESRNILASTSFGFRKNMSTNTCLSFVINSIKRNKRDGFVSAMVCIDLSNAFNAVQTDKLEEILCSFSVPNEIVVWINSFLCNRRVVMKLRNGTASRLITNGLPQGDVLSPTLFNLYTAGLHEIASVDVVLVQYADDFGIIVKARNVDLLEVAVQKAVDAFSRRAEQLNFKVNPEKTKTILFTNNEKSLDVKINGVPLETVKNTRYLGVTIDRYLSFGVHIKETRAKINERLNMLKVISGVKNGSNPQVMMNIYKSMIRSLMEYGCTVTWNARKTNRGLLRTLNNQCLRKATGCAKSTPLNALAAISAQEPLDLRMEYATGRNIARCFERRNIVSEQLQEVPEFEKEMEDKYSYMEVTYNKNRNLYNQIMPIVDVSELTDVEICSSLEGIIGSKQNQSRIALKQASLCVMNGKYKGRGRVFTDASKESTICAVGVFIESTQTRKSFRLEYDVSITAAEIQALRTALKLIEEGQLKNHVIYTDSMTACHMLENALETRKAETVLADILEVAHRWGVSIQWIPSHVGTHGNELADELARLGLGPNSEMLRHDLFVKDVFSLLKAQMLHATKEWYKDYSTEKGKRFFEIQSEYCEKPWYHGENLDSKEIRLINRLMTGHNYSRYWLARMKIVDDGECELCQEEETADHLIMTCLKLGHIRQAYSFECKYRTLVDALKTKDIGLYKEIADFVRVCKLEL